MIADDSPALGPICVCSPFHEERGLYSPDCLVHAHWRCTHTGCPEPASDAHLCVIHGRHLKALSPWGEPFTLGESDRESDRYERWMEGA